jgi:hypothetical protein
MSLVRCEVKGCETLLVPDARGSAPRTVCSEHWKQRRVQDERERASKPKPKNLTAMIRSTHRPPRKSR